MVIEKIENLNRWRVDFSLRLKVVRSCGLIVHGVGARAEGFETPESEERDSAASSAATRKLGCRKAHEQKVAVSHPVASTRSDANGTLINKVAAMATAATITGNAGRSARCVSVESINQGNMNALVQISQTYWKPFGVMQRYPANAQECAGQIGNEQR